MVLFWPSMVTSDMRALRWSALWEGKDLMMAWNSIEFDSLILSMAFFNSSSGTREVSKGWVMVLRATSKSAIFFIRITVDFFLTDGLFFDLT
jgi:hypothetical protein